MKIFGIKECRIKKYLSGTLEGGILKLSEEEEFNLYLELMKKQYPGAYTESTPIWSYIKPSKEIKSYTEFLNDLKSTNPEEYNRLMESSAQSETSEVSKPWIDAKGNVRRSTNIGAGFVSGTDPVGALYIEGTILGKPLELIGMPLVLRISKKYIPQLKKLVIGPDGKIFNSKINYNPNNYYRGVKKDAIIDAKNTGIIRGSDISKKVGEGSGPWFGRGRPGFNRDYIIEGTPESAEWIDALKYLKGIIDKLPKVNPNNSVTGRNIYDYDFLYGNEGFPMTSGNVNQTPISNFIYYKKYPLFGWRQKEF